MSIIKLQNEGDTLTMTVAGCEQVKGQYGEQVKFTTEKGDQLYLPKDSADRQLTRLGLDYETVIHEALTFSRDHNPKVGAKPYWGISPAKAETPVSPRVGSPYATPTKPLPFDAPVEAEFDEDSFASFSDAVDHIADPYAAPKLTPREVAATTAHDRKAHARTAWETAYLALYGRVLTGMLKAHVEAGDESPNVSSDAVQAACATLVIQWGKAGLV